MTCRTWLAIAVFISAAAAAETPVAPAALGVSFIEGSTSTLWIERGGKKYLVDVAAHRGLSR